MSTSSMAGRRSRIQRSSGLVVNMHATVSRDLLRGWPRRRCNSSATLLLAPSRVIGMHRNR